MQIHLSGHQNLSSQDGDSGALNQAWGPSDAHETSPVYKTGW